MIKYIVYMAGPRKSNKIAMRQPYLEKNKQIFMILGFVLGVPSLGFVLYKIFGDAKTKKAKNTTSIDETKVLNEKITELTTKITEEYNSVKTEIDTLLDKENLTALEKFYFLKL